MTECGLEAACKWDAYCHAHQPPIPFIRTETRGLFGTIFCDFGPAFTVFDLDGTLNASLLPSCMGVYTRRCAYTPKPGISQQESTREKLRVLSSPQAPFPMSA
jgi:hypothetical protein